MKPIDEKIAVVTGASRGIGRAIALRLAKDGALVSVHYSYGKLNHWASRHLPFSTHSD